VTLVGILRRVLLFLLFSLVIDGLSLLPAVNDHLLILFILHLVYIFDEILVHDVLWVLDLLLLR